MNYLIQANNISKTYKLTHEKLPAYRSLRDDMMEFLKHPFPKTQPQEVFWALKNISFTIQKGEAVGIIGANGAGKSTLLKILSRITPPTHGQVRLNGRVASLLEVGTGFHPELTGRENIFLSGAILGLRRHEIIEQFNDIVSFAEVEKFLDTPVKHYSSGMYVRLAFAVAAHLDPEILLIDEILAVGDIRFQKKSLGRMKTLGKSGKTILFVSHNLAAIRSFCNRVLLLQNGTIIADGDVGMVIEKYTKDIQRNVFHIEWNDPLQAPRNAACIVEKVTITNQDGTIPDQLTIDDAFDIRIQYKTVRENSFVGFMLQFFDDENKCLFFTINNHETQWYAKPMPKGTYTSICAIPPHFFNSAVVSIRLQVLDANFTDPYTTNDILYIDFLDNAFVRGDYYGEYWGSLRPLFTWKTKKNI